MLYPIGIPTPNGYWAQTKNTRGCVGADEPDVLFYCAYFCLCIYTVVVEREDCVTREATTTASRHRLSRKASET